MNTLAAVGGPSSENARRTSLTSLAISPQIHEARSIAGVAAAAAAAGPCGPGSPANSRAVAATDQLNMLPREVVVMAAITLLYGLIGIFFSAPRE